MASHTTGRSRRLKIRTSKLFSHIRVPRNHVFDLTIQRELPWNMLVEIGYIGRLARDLYVAGNLNSVPIMQKDPKSGQTFAQAFDAVAMRLRSNGQPSA